MSTLFRHFACVALFLAFCTACNDTVETPTSPDESTSSSGSFTFGTTITARGSASRSFVTATTGTITMTVTNTVPLVTLGFGIGIPRADGGGCNLTRSAEADGQTELRLEVIAEAGSYCVKVFDTGQVSGEVTFSATVSHP